MEKELKSGEVISEENINILKEDILKIIDKIDRTDPFGTSLAISDISKMLHALNIEMWKNFIILRIYEKNDFKDEIDVDKLTINELSMFNFCMHKLED